ncbi:MAG TPA: hypothetical protein VK464_14795 [Symbiobacteriaceae bacterium]|jgi:hypothetical protein|nr:hypothetical protein [Symbiobacteriaceae bacterium]
MTDKNRIAPQYQGMVNDTAEQPEATQATSATQEQLSEMREGERWSHEATERTYNSGGNQEATTPESQRRSY